jgi:Uma2 family endonuclease
MATANLAPLTQPTSAPPLIVGPEHHGLPMAYHEYGEADFQSGWRYELSRGIVIVTQIPGIHHGLTVLRFARLFLLYNEVHPGVIHYQGGGAETRLRLEGMMSDRHPDQAIYLRPYPKGPDLWARWAPDLAVEVVSQGGEDRDYILKREEYLVAGVREYWILDLVLRRLMVLVNVGGTWQQSLLGEEDILRTELLPGLEARVGDLLGPPPEAEDD